MNIIVKNKVKITQIEPNLHRKLINDLTLPNPLWYKLQRMGKIKALFAVPKEFKYYKEIKNGLIVGRGVLASLPQKKFGYSNLTTIPPINRPLETNIELRDYQEGIIEEIDPLKNNVGILRCDTGWGKTILALKIAEVCQTKTLVIVSRLHLSEQFKQTIKDVLVSDNEQDIEVKTIQSLRNEYKKSSDEFYKKYGNKYGLVIVDEAHQYVPKKSKDVIQSFNCRYLYGLTATPRRTDKQSKAINFIFGEQLCDRKLEKRTPGIKLIEFTGRIPVWEYHEMIDNQIENYNRNLMIINNINKEIEQGRQILCLTKRIKHYKILYELLQRTENRHFLTTIASSLPKKDLAKKINDLRKGVVPFDCLFGTYSMLSCGLDVPSIDTLVIAGDLKSEVLVEQSAGRILRLFKNKQNPKIIDIWDKANPILYRQGKERQKFYKNNNWPLGA